MSQSKDLQSQDLFSSDDPVSPGQQSTTESEGHSEHSLIIRRKRRQYEDNSQEFSTQDLETEMEADVSMDSFQGPTEEASSPVETPAQSTRARGRGRGSRRGQSTPSSSQTPRTREKLYALTDDQEEVFINYLKANPAIWDNKHQKYMDRVERER